MPRMTSFALPAENPQERRTKAVLQQQRERSLICSRQERSKQASVFTPMRFDLAAPPAAAAFRMNDAPHDFEESRLISRLRDMAAKELRFSFARSISGSERAAGKSEHRQVWL